MAIKKARGCGVPQAFSFTLIASWQGRFRVIVRPSKLTCWRQGDAVSSTIPRCQTTGLTRRRDRYQTKPMPRRSGIAPAPAIGPGTAVGVGTQSGHATVSIERAIESILPWKFPSTDVIRSEPAPVLEDVNENVTSTAPCAKPFRLKVPRLVVVLSTKSNALPLSFC